jgi:hypothetical protein
MGAKRVRAWMYVRDGELVTPWLYETRAMMPWPVRGARRIARVEIRELPKRKAKRGK